MVDRSTDSKPRFTRAWIITAKTRETIIEKYRAILRELRFYPETLGEIDGNPSYIVQRFRDWLNNNHKWLLIFDGVVDEDPFNYLPSHFEGTVLMTTQNRGFDTESFSLVVMNKMTDDEAVELVNKSIPSRSPITRGRAVQLAQTLGNLPIAISAACCFIRRQDTLPMDRIIANFLQDFQSSRGKWPESEFEVVWFVFERSIEDLMRRSEKHNVLKEDFFDILNLLSELGHVPSDLLQCAHENFRKKYPSSCVLPQSVLDTHFAIFTRSRSVDWTKHPIHKVLALLKSNSLIDYEPYESSFECSIHSLLRRYMRSIRFSNESTDRTESEAWIKTVGTLADALTPGEDVCHYANRRAAVPHITELLEDISAKGRDAVATLCLMKNDNENCLEIALRFASALSESGKFKDALNLRQMVVQRLPVLNSSSVLSVLNVRARTDLAASKSDIGLVDDAKSISLELLSAIASSSISHNIKEVLVIKANLAGYHQRSGEFIDAYRLRREVFRTRSTLYGRDEIGTINAWRKLASTLHSLGVRPDTLKYRQEACNRAIHLKKFSNICQEKHIDILRLEGDYAESLANAGQFLKAIQLQKDVLERWHANWGDRHTETIQARTRLANMLQDLGGGQNSKEAHTLLEDTVRLVRDYSGINSPEMLNAEMRLVVSGVKSDAIGLQEALHLQRDVVDRLRQLPKKQTRHELLEAMDQLGSLLIKTNDHEQRLEGLSLKRAVYQDRKKCQETSISFDLQAFKAERKLIVALGKLGRKNRPDFLEEQLELQIENVYRWFDYPPLDPPLYSLLEEDSATFHPAALLAMLDLADIFDQLGDLDRVAILVVRLQRDVPDRYRQIGAILSESVQSGIKHHWGGKKQNEFIAFQIRSGMRNLIETTFGRDNAHTLRLWKKIAYRLYSSPKTKGEAHELLRRVVSGLELLRGKDDRKTVALTKELVAWDRHANDDNGMAEIVIGTMVNKREDRDWTLVHYTRRLSLNFCSP